MRKVIVIVACMGLSLYAQEYGGVLRYATIGEPPHLDLMLVTSDLASTIGQHIFETLFTFDKNYAPIPHLVENYEILDEGRNIILHLRHGVLFHNGKEMTAEDVAASLRRWLQFGVRGSLMAKYVTQVVVEDLYTVRLVFADRYAPWQALLAFNNGGPMIIPKEIAEIAGSRPLDPSQYIGTGPYKFVEWVPGSYIKLARFAQYSSRSDPPNGYGGARHPYIEEISFIPVPDAATRWAGIKAGDYDYAENIPTDLYSMVKADQTLASYLLTPPAFMLLFRNTRQGIMANNIMFQAVLAALNMEEIMRAAFGEMYALSPCPYPENTVWYTETGKDKYNQANYNKAHELLEQAGYKGEPIRFLTNTSYPFHYQCSLVIADQLRKAGLNIDLRVYDWATMVQYRAKPEEWDLFITSHGPVPDPILITYLSATYPGWWDTERKRELLGKFTTTLDFSERFKIWEDLQDLLYEEGSAIVLGQYFILNISARARVAGLEDPNHPALLWPYFWNTWLKK
ncbi:MAG: ABC transporter substrate-binding protein [Candidatus Hadarchaeum sp.]|uniref:ABC transporter substrate-binding protein n=1 Tax=Candidatus Hadarchaeum sp. TaxID=2883567 RepID=UPI0031821583